MSKSLHTLIIAGFRSITMLRRRRHYGRDDGMATRIHFSRDLRGSG